MLGKKFTGAVLGFMFVTNSAIAQHIQLDVLQFQTPTEPYIEVQLELPAALLGLEQVEGGLRSVGEVTCILEQSGEVVSFTKRNLTGPVMSDSAEANAGSHYHVDRLIARTGTGRVTVEIRSEAGGAAATAAVDVRLAELDLPHFSSPMLVEAYGPAEAGSPYAHSGIDLLPVVGARVGFDAEELRYYMELYGVEHVPDSLIYIANWLQDADGVELQGSRVYQRVVKGQILPIFTTRPWGSQASAARTLVWEAVSKTAGVLCREELPLAVESARIEVDGLAPFAAAWTDREALMRHLEDHQPRATPSQQRMIRDVLPALDLGQMQSFLHRFWHLQAPEDPSAAYADYVRDIAYVDERWGACYKGHGADSDMGYVYLRYGAPNTVVQRHNETDYYPYEIWHYHRAGQFSDKRFLFFSPHMVAECFDLLHSDMLGEVSNQDWLTVLRNRENSLRVTESQLNRSNPRDTYSREEPEDLFYNPR